MSVSAAADRLSPDEIERYRDAGIVIPRHRLPSARIESLRATLDRLVAENPTVRPERLVSAHIEGRNSEGVRGSRRKRALPDEGAPDNPVLDGDLARLLRERFGGGGEG